MEPLNEKPAWYTLLMVLLGGFVGFIVGNLVGVMVGYALYRGDGNFLQAVSNPDAYMVVPMLTMQGLISFFSFLAFPYLNWKIARHKSLRFFNAQPFYGQSIFFVVTIVLSFVVVDSIIIEWNQNIHLPEFLK